VWDGRSPLLDVGTGTAQIPIELARTAPTVRVVATDLAGSMLALAAENVKRACLRDQIQLQACDAKALPFGDESFAGVISNSIIHHIPEPVRVLQEMARIAAKGAVLFVRDLLRPADEAECARLVDLYTAGANAHQRQMFDDSLRAALTLAEIRLLVAGLGFDPSALRQTSDRHWTWVGRKT
jgi:ubiquinone/menaquinone biosynthesis C-methylase UbiE